MIGRICGILLEKQAPFLLVDVNGLGFEVHLPLNCFHRLGQIGEKIVLYTHFVVREDGHFLYGFLDKKQRTMFRSLIRVNNVGPKLALAILSTMEPETFAHHILHNDIAALIRIPGVGEKTAQRLLVEMRDRLDDFAVAMEVAESNDALASRDAISALITLGYKPHEAKKAVDRHKGENISSEELIRMALKEI